MDPLARRIPVSLVDVPIQRALAIIAEQSHVRLTYSSDDLPPGRRISLSDTSVTVGAALDVVLATTALHAVAMSDGSVVLTTAVSRTDGQIGAAATAGDSSGTLIGVLLGRRRWSAGTIWNRDDR